MKRTVRGRRRRPPKAIQEKVAVLSRRRCCICFGLRGDQCEKLGQLAHLDRNHSNYKLVNLAWLCLTCHSTYDRKGHQAKGLLPGEAKAYRKELYAWVKTNINGQGRVDSAEFALSPLRNIAAAIRHRLSQRVPATDQDIIDNSLIPTGFNALKDAGVSVASSIPGLDRTLSLTMFAVNHNVPLVRQVTALLLGLMNKKEQRTRITIMGAHYQASAARSALLQLHKDQNPVVRTTALLALKFIDERQLVADVAVVSILSTLRSDSDTKQLFIFERDATRKAVGTRAAFKKGLLDAYVGAWKQPLASSQKAKTPHNADARVEALLSDYENEELRIRGGSFQTDPG